MEILSRANLRQKIQNNPLKHEAIVISYQEPVDDIFPLCKNSLRLEFRDILNPNKEGAPTKSQIEQALAWAKGKDPLISCAAGISRSAAIAYLIKYQEDPSEALKLLKTEHHRPNQLILKYGVDIFGKEVVQPLIQLYENAQAHSANLWAFKIYLTDLATVLN